MQIPGGASTTKAASEEDSVEYLDRLEQFSETILVRPYSFIDQPLAHNLLKLFNSTVLSVAYLEESRRSSNACSLGIAPRGTKG